MRPLLCCTLLAEALGSREAHQLARSRTLQPILKDAPAAHAGRREKVLERCAGWLSAGRVAGQKLGNCSKMLDYPSPEQFCCEFQSSTANLCKLGQFGLMLTEL